MAKKEENKKCECPCHLEKFRGYQSLCCPNCLEEHKDEYWYEEIKNY